MSPHLDNFSDHCRLYFQKSLSIGNVISQNEHDEEYQACEVVLEALHHQLINIHEESISHEYKEFIMSEKVKKFSNQLQSCGLLVDQEDLLLARPTTKTAHTQDQQMLMEYSQIRDQQRRQAHKLQMEQRKTYLNKLMQAKLKTSSELPAFTDTTGQTMEGSVLSQEFLMRVRKIVKYFCRKYKDGIGTHSFLAGVKTMIEKQLASEEVILWTFNGCTLSEASISSTDTNHEKYMDEAVELLNSFMAFNPNEDRMEKAKGQEFESMYSFHTHTSISNPFLRYILSEFPPTGDLHARPAGSFEPMPGATERRNNIDGDLDEHSMSMLPWKQGLRCEIL
jgi:hypothetical protein